MGMNYAVIHAIISLDMIARRRPFYRVRPAGGFPLMDIQKLRQKTKWLFSANQHTLQHRLFWAYVSMPAIFLVVFAIFFYYYVSGILISNERDALSTLNNTFAERIDAAINDLDTTSANINYSNLMKDKLDNSFNLDISETTLPELADLFVTINGTDLKADQINLYDMKGNVVKVGMITNTGSVDPASLPWLDEVKRLNGIKLIGDPYYTNAYSYSSSSDWFLSVYRTYSNQYGRKVGTIETLKRCKSIFKSVISYQKKTGDHPDTYIFNSEGKMVFPYSLSEEEKDCYTYYYRILSKISDQSNTVLNPLTGDKEQLASYESAYSGWTYISVQKETLILKPVTRMIWILCLVVISLLIISLLISYYLSRKMTNPIKHLKHIIQRMELDTFGQDQTASYNPAYLELVELYHAFQKMSEKLKLSMNELIDTRQQELKSRTLALQSQMNPHFYYNTLSCIIVLAENSRSEEVITLCRSLSQIMRYITDNSSTLICLKEEIDYVQKYLYCMKVRYQSSLTCTIDVDPALCSIIVPKLIIQPLVENAVKYGTDCIPPWSITVRGEDLKDRWQITVTDSGNGFTEEAIRMLHEKIKEADSNPGMPELTIDGLGLLNVYMRWRIYKKEQALFSFGNTPEGHAFVTIGAKKEGGNQ